MSDSSSKKENHKKKLSKQKEKADKRALKKEHNNKGKSLDDMIIYVDVNGHFTDIPTHLQDRRLPGEIDNDGNKKAELFKGRINHINEKGFGFIKEDVTKEKIFYHNSNLQSEIEINDKVQFNKEYKTSGLQAVNIKKEY